MPTKAIAACNQLQFGHSLTAVENLRRLLEAAAPIGTLQFGHSLTAVENTHHGRSRRPAAGSFNLATALQPWRTPHAGAIWFILRYASIWPQPYSRGEPPEVRVR